MRQVLIYNNIFVNDFLIGEKAKMSDYKKAEKQLLRSQLTELEYQVTQHDATEPAFNNKYWDNKTTGIYVDITSGEPLFCSLDKYDSFCGWPSFTRPLEEHLITEKSDKKLFTLRTEVRSTTADAHLGHVFDDGPQQSGGLRYCINSASLRFIALDQMCDEGYAEFLSLFE